MLPDADRQRGGVAMTTDGASGSYDVHEVRSPRLAGVALRAFTRVAESPGAGPLLRAQMRKQLGLDRLLAASAAGCVPARAPFGSYPGSGDPGLAIDDRLAAAGRAAERVGSAAPSTTVADFARAYREGEVTPLDVARSVLAQTAASEAGERPLRLFISQDAGDLLAQAEASAARHAAGRPLSVLDGVPVAVKDEVDQTPYPTTVGTRYLGVAPAAADGTTVARLRAAGALLIGKANMHELGLGVTGINPHHGAARNPYDDGHVTGGSSSGPAAAVAAGLCPVALGADGGGSIRIPAALCGVVGLKPTIGRISEHGAAPLCWSVAHLGPIGLTARDTAAAYAILAGVDPADPATAAQPPPTLASFGRADLRGVRLGVFRPWFEHADDAVVAACEEALAVLREAGVEVVEVALRDLELVRLAHLVIIASEMATARLGDDRAHRGELGFDTRLNFALARDLTATQYVHARRLRDRVTSALDAVLDLVDGLAVPATACTAPPIRADALASGESDLATLDRLMRFAPLANLTGHPAIAFPVGYDAAALPIGLQVIGRAWREDLLLELAHHVELRTPRRPPVRHYPVLPATSSTVVPEATS